MDDDPIVGWRGWRYSPTTGHLHSMVWKHRWTPLEPFEAEVPLEEGFLGVHAWRKRGQLDNIIKLDETSIPVWGEVSLWGVVVEHEGGYRAQYAYPLSLLVLPGDGRYCTTLSSTYAVEARTLG